MSSRPIWEVYLRPKKKKKKRKFCSFSKSGAQSARDGKTDNFPFGLLTNFQ